MLLTVVGYSPEPALASLDSSKSKWQICDLANYQLFCSALGTSNNHHNGNVITCARLTTMVQPRDFCQPIVLPTCALQMIQRFNSIIT